jgi:hypothetical protein
VYMGGSIRMAWMSGRIRLRSLPRSVFAPYSSPAGGVRAEVEI